MFPIDGIEADDSADCSARAPLRKKAEKPDLWLLPGESLMRAAIVMARGNEKYTEGSWRGVSVRALVSAAMRHLVAYSGGDKTDSETGLSHLDHALASVLFAVANAARDSGTK